MDHVKVYSPTGAAGTPLALPEFTLVSLDTLGSPQGLPPGLGDLSLYLEHDGFCSVNGPRDFTALPLCSAVAPVSHDGSSMIEHSATVISDHTQSCLDDVISSGQQAHSARRGYLCGEPGCTWRASFPTKQALDRHHEVKHLNKRVDCPVPGCERVGDKGIKRKDNFPTHVWNKHGIKLPRQPHGN